MNEKQNTQVLLDIDNLPNRLTIFRMALIPLVVGCLFLQNQTYDWVIPYHIKLGWIACWIFVIASITDFLDGYIARKRNIITRFGSFLDPIADKFLVVSSLIMLQDLGHIPSLVVIILILREFYMTSLRLLALTEGIHVPVQFAGKLKTATQMIGIPLLMANEPDFFGLSFPLLGNIMIYIATFISIYSAIIYSLGLIKKLKNKMSSHEPSQS